jgi:hypothetical protein
MGDLDEIDEDVYPDTSISIPHKNELGMGHELVFEFVHNHMPDDYDEVRQIFRRRGAYGKFKNLLASRGLLQIWYDFENQQEKQALQQWCKDSGLEVSD